MWIVQGNTFSPSYWTGTPQSARRSTPCRVPATRCGRSAAVDQPLAQLGASSSSPSALGADSLTPALVSALTLQKAGIEASHTGQFLAKLFASAKPSRKKNAA